MSHISSPSCASANAPVAVVLAPVEPVVEVVPPPTVRDNMETEPVSLSTTVADSGLISSPFRDPGIPKPKMIVSTSPPRVRVIREYPELEISRTTVTTTASDGLVITCNEALESSREGGLATAPIPTVENSPAGEHRPLLTVAPSIELRRNAGPVLLPTSQAKVQGAEHPRIGLIESQLWELDSKVTSVLSRLDRQISEKVSFALQHQKLGTLEEIIQLEEKQIDSIQRIEEDSAVHIEFRQKLASLQLTIDDNVLEAFRQLREQTVSLVEHVENLSDRVAKAEEALVQQPSKLSMAMFAHSQPGEESEWSDRDAQMSREHFLILEERIAGLESSFGEFCQTQDHNLRAARAELLSMTTDVFRSFEEKINWYDAHIMKLLEIEQQPASTPATKQYLSSNALYDVGCSSMIDTCDVPLDASYDRIQSEYEARDMYKDCHAASVDADLAAREALAALRNRLQVDTVASPQVIASRMSSPAASPEKRDDSPGRARAPAGVAAVFANGQWQTPGQIKQPQQQPVRHSGLQKVKEVAQRVEEKVVVKAHNVQSRVAAQAHNVESKVAAHAHNTGAKVAAHAHNVEAKMAKHAHDAVYVVEEKIVEEERRVLAAGERLERSVEKAAQETMQELGGWFQNGEDWLLNKVGGRVPSSPSRERQTAVDSPPRGASTPTHERARPFQDLPRFGTSQESRNSGRERLPQSRPASEAIEELKRSRAAQEALEAVPTSGIGLKTEERALRRSASMRAKAAAGPSATRARTPPRQVPEGVRTRTPGRTSPGRADVKRPTSPAQTRRQVR